MIVKKLQVENLRNLSRAEIVPHPHLNYLYGDNGAGKTSVLESLVVLSRGRSFRTSLASELIGPDENTFRVYALVQNKTGQTSRMGLERSGRRWRGRLDGRDLSQLSHLTRHLPIVLMEPDSHALVSGAPDIRRKYLDWGMFHVKHAFLETWRRYSKALKQRNAALRRNQEGLLDSLDIVLAEQGEALGALRKAHAAAVSEQIGGVIGALSARVPDITFSYQDGWSSDSSYLDALHGNRRKDIERGTTLMGPHRADLVFRSGKQAARAVLSRGEQKTFAAALILTQARLLAAGGGQPVLLFDDLISEFDHDHFTRVLQSALEMNTQVWVTGTAKPQLKHDHKVFHVEQGTVTEVV